MDTSLDRTFDQIISQLKSKNKETDIIFIIAPTPQGLQAIKQINQAKNQSPIIMVRDMSGMDYYQYANSLRKSSTPFFKYINGSFVEMPIIFESTDEKGQRFIKEYKSLYGEKPDFRAAYAYDTALVLTSAIMQKKIKGERQSIQEDRKHIHHFLKECYSSEKAIIGTTGLIYFDAKRNSPKPVKIGIIQNQTIIPALTQFTMIDDKNVLSKSVVLTKKSTDGLESENLNTTNIKYCLYRCLC